MKQRQTLAIIGTGPSCIYLLKHLLDGAEKFREDLAAIEVFEKRRTAGMGMPYHPETTERWNMSNISSEEIPELLMPLADWLRGLNAEKLEEFGIEVGKVSESAIYSRLALGEYLHAQYQGIIAGLTMAGISVRERTHCKIVDVVEEGERVTLVDDESARFFYDRVVLATGHYWPEDDHPEVGYYVSPWPVAKLLPKDGERFNFAIGTLGASLSAIDVVTSLAHWHGVFEDVDGKLTYRPAAETDGFRIEMHAGDGLLPHLQYAQAEPLREIERHVSQKELLALRDEDGFLRLKTYFDRVCRPVLSDALEKDGRTDIVEQLREPDFGLAEFGERMAKEHVYEDVFDGMEREMKEGEGALADDRPIHWKEALDDLMYTLNFYAELMPAEDHLALHSKFLPFLMNVIAALPLQSARKLLALHKAGKLELVIGRVKVAEPALGDSFTTIEIDNEGRQVTTKYRMFVDCSGQGALSVEDFPFPSLRTGGATREARVAFKDAVVAGELPEEKRAKVIEKNGQCWYPIGGIEIDRAYRLIGQDGDASRRVFNIAFPHISGVRPYSYGLQACNESARILVDEWLGRGPER